MYIDLERILLISCILKIFFSILKTITIDKKAFRKKGFGCTDFREKYDSRKRTFRNFNSGKKSDIILN